MHLNNVRVLVCLDDQAVGPVVEIHVHELIS